LACCISCDLLVDFRLDLYLSAKVHIFLETHKYFPLVFAASLVFLKQEQPPNFFIRLMVYSCYLPVKEPLN
jgi:hypothetical protein